ncbi:MAG TPA: DUF3105 domain-containing protein [Cryptosporangiaceae bacterium]|nr:DUF3105 domain-containing protein [Cryptosporangiaceae bacterium]
MGLALGIPVLLLLCGGIGIGGYFLYRADVNRGTGSEVVDYRQKNPGILTRTHATGRVNYPVTPPVGGDHSVYWQNCEGDVYADLIPSEHAVHSLEHGAVWVTYRPDLPRDDVNRLEDRVRGRDYLFMSHYPGLDRPISLQAWGYQLKVDSADDPDIDAFIQKYRRTASLEPGATCGSGSTTLGTTPD